MLMSKQVILTGLRANNDLHIGNYLGAIMPTVDMAMRKADQYQVNLFVPDLHSFTTPIDYTLLQEAIMNNIRVYIAAGLPIANENVHIYRQSYVPAHSELTIILNNFVGIGEMGRMTQFKDKSSKLDNDRISVGLFDYPVLMAADILLYGASYVPVGDDQSQHLEITRDIAIRLNNQFGELFTVPKPVKEQHAFFGKDQGLRIKDLQDPAKKMSKSDETGKGVIFLTDTPEVARKKIMSAVTDDERLIKHDPNNKPGISNLMEILGIFRGGDYAGVRNEFTGTKEYGSFKSAVADSVCAFLEDFQARLAKVDDSLVLTKLQASEKAMNQQANETLLKVQKAVGLR